MYHNIERLLLLTIIVKSKNWMISIIVKENIVANKQNQLIAHPRMDHLKYTQVHICYTHAACDTCMLHTHNMIICVMVSGWIQRFC